MLLQLCILVFIRYCSIFCNAERYMKKSHNRARTFVFVYQEIHRLPRTNLKILKMEMFLEKIAILRLRSSELLSTLVKN